MQTHIRARTHKLIARLNRLQGEGGTRAEEEDEIKEWLVRGRKDKEKGLGQT